MFVHLSLYAGLRTRDFCILLYASIILKEHVRSPLSRQGDVCRVDAIASWSSPCLYERSFSFVILYIRPVILYEAAGGVKDLRYYNVYEMCPTDSSLLLRMTEA